MAAEHSPGASAHLRRAEASDPAPRPAPPTGARPPAAEASRLLTVYAVPGIGRIRPGTDLGRELGAALVDSRLELKDGDVLVVASKIVSKAEGALAAVRNRAEFERLVSAVGTHVVARRAYASGRTLSIVRTPAGTVQAAAGLDTSNLDAPEVPGAPEASHVLLQPEDADASAARIRTALWEMLRVDVGVIVSDTSSRPWRAGVSDIALGCAGLAPLDSQRGLPDDTGRTQSLTVRAVADEIASAADLVKGSARGRPAAVVRGVAEMVGEARARTAAEALTRPLDEDWFRTGTAESVWSALGTDHASPEIAPPSADGSEGLTSRAGRALAVARQGTPRTPGHRSWAATVKGAGSVISVRMRKSPAEPEAGGHAVVEAAVGLGSLVERIVTALAAEDLGAVTDWHWRDNGVPAGCDIRLSLTQPAAAPAVP
ncbi:coenzyme F420-0:L-glutamate ligase [Brevibacterium salitolerans]|jgi:coenzyme F420-0:L-glutamate ligase/coenzyme F420-1:gamma-L-glutamate ligase|uniref:Coenzyme F420-0:L-glutamate ligase n=2 Tax=Brevibacterium TaxID=1696 RepID=A0ABN2W8U6_9MICO